MIMVLVMLMLGEQISGYAQAPDITWKEPENLSNTPTSSIFPAVVSDRYGFVHVFWGEDLEGKVVDPENPENRSNSIVYSFWDGNRWSIPVDIFTASSGSAYNFPYATIDSADTLHLVWQSYQGIYYSSVALNEASKVKAWQPARLIARIRGDGPRIYASSRWGLQVIYPAWEDVERGTHDGNVYYMRSQDDGETWSIPVQLSSVAGSGGANTSHPSLVESDAGTTHAVWFEAEAPDWRGSVVYYSRSDDGGVSWSTPEEIGRRTGDERWASMPEIIKLNDSEVHITWVCGINAYRCHRWSQDDGKSWSSTNHEFGDMLSLAGWDTLVVDGSGRLYWIMQLREPGAIYSSYWTGRQWSPLQIVNDGFLAGGHYLRAVVHNGNQLDLVMVQQESSIQGEAKEIWYINGVTSASSVEPEKQSKLISTLPVSVTPTVEGLTNKNQSQVLDNDERNGNDPSLHQSVLEVVDPNDNPTGRILAVSILPVISLFFVIIFIRYVYSKIK